MSGTYFYSFLLITLLLVTGIQSQLGIVTGGIYQGVPQSMQDNALNIFCEYVQLGVKWIRIQSDWPGTDISTYQSIVQIAHANGIAVDVIVPAQYCGDDSNNTAIDAFTSAYTSHLDYLISNVFVGSASVDAYEIGNEPNIVETGCPDGQSRFRVSPNAFSLFIMDPDRLIILVFILTILIPSTRDVLILEAPIAFLVGLNKLLLASLKLASAYFKYLFIFLWFLFLTLLQSCRRGYSNGRNSPFCY